MIQEIPPDSKEHQSKGSSEQILLADLDHFSQSMWRNEEVGEKRFNFFLTLVTAVTAGLVALATNGNAGGRYSMRLIAGLALLFLLLVGFMTYLRMLKRNQVTDEYQDTLDVIRKKLRGAYKELEDYQVPVIRTRLPWLLSGGYAESVAVINGLLLAGHTYLAWCSSIPVAAILGVEAIGLQLIPSFLRHRRKNLVRQDGRRS